MSLTGEFQGLRILTKDNSETVEDSLDNLISDIQNLFGSNPQEGDIALGILVDSMIVVKLEVSNGVMLAEDTQNGKNIGTFDISSGVFTYESDDGTIIPNIQLVDSLTGSVLQLIEPILTSFRTDNLHGTITYELQDSVGRIINSGEIINIPYNIQGDELDNDIIASLFNNIGNRLHNVKEEVTELKKFRSRSVLMNTIRLKNKLRR